eukprot:UN28369
MADCCQLSPKVIQRIMKEIHRIKSNPIPGINVDFNEENVAEVQASLEGPDSTPYEGGVFRVKIIFSSSFPEEPPKGLFMTKVFHPNVSESGEICVNQLKRDWKSSLGLKHILLIVRSLMIHPNANSALNAEAASLLNQSYKLFAQRAKLITRLWATPPMKENNNFSRNNFIANNNQNSQTPSPKNQHPNIWKQNAPNYLKYNETQGYNNAKGMGYPNNNIKQSKNNQKLKKKSSNHNNNNSGDEKIMTKNL